MDFSAIDASTMALLHIVFPGPWPSKPSHARRLGAIHAQCQRAALGL